MVEGYNPDLVKKVSSEFIKNVKKHGFLFNRTSFEEYNQNIKEEGKKLYSCYFNVTKRKNSWKIRVADHPHNNIYDITSNFQIVIDKPDNYSMSNNKLRDYVYHKTSQFLKSTKLSNENYRDIIGQLNNQDLFDEFLRNYSTNPKWFPKLVQKYGIDSKHINSDWFKKEFFQKCTEYTNKNPKFWKNWVDTFIYLYMTKQIQRLSHY